MPPEPIDSAPRGALPETAAASQQLHLRQSAHGIFAAFQRSQAIPTPGRAGRQNVEQRPVVVESAAAPSRPSPAAPVKTLADLKRTTKPAARRIVEDADGGFDPTVGGTVPPRSASGASLAAGALRKMTINKTS